MDKVQELCTGELDAKTKTLFTAAKSANLETVKSLICEGADPVATQYNINEPNILHILYERLKRCVYKQRVLHIIEYVLSLPQFQKRSYKSETVYREILDYMARNSFCNFKMVSLMLSLILKLNFINDLVFVRKIIPSLVDQGEITLKMNVAALFVSELMNGNTRTVISEKLTKFLLSLSDIGFSMKESEGCVTVLTMYVLQLPTMQPNNHVFDRTVVNKFIEDGVNVESSTVTFRNPGNMAFYNILLPDVIFVSFLNKMNNIFGMFLPYWWAPPATLYAFRYGGGIFGAHSFFPCKYFCQLTSYGKVPHGTVIFRQLNRGMRSLMQIVNANGAMNDNKIMLLRQMRASYQQMTDSPLHLTDIAKYAVRRALATRAAKPGTNLPMLLREVLPDDMHTLAEYVRME